MSKLIGETKKLAAPPLSASENPEDVTKPWLIAEAMRTYNAAMRAGQAGAAKNCLELFAKLTGILVERKELRVIRSIEDLTDEELSAIVACDRSTETTRGTDECPTADNRFCPMTRSQRANPANFCDFVLSVSGQVLLKQGLNCRKAVSKDCNRRRLGALPAIGSALSIGSEVFSSLCPTRWNP